MSTILQDVDLGEQDSWGIVFRLRPVVNLTDEQLFEVLDRPKVVPCGLPLRGFKLDLKTIV